MDRYKSILLNSVIGDALGSSVEGMSRKHIRSVFKTITDYVDPAPALRGKPEKWKKPGLYSSASQLMLILSLACQGHACRTENFTRHLRDLPEVEDWQYSIFRNPGPVERPFISAVKTGDIKNPPTNPCSRILPMAIPLSHISLTEEQLTVNCINIIKLFTTDAATISGTLLFSMLLQKLYNETSVRSEDIISHALSSNSTLLARITAEPDTVFSAGVNPDAITRSLEMYGSVLASIDKIPDHDTAEKAVCENLNMTLKTPVTRASVNHPLSIIPWALYLVKHNSDTPGALLFTAAGGGGSSSSLGSLAGALLGSLHMMDMTPGILLRNLVNRKRILAVVESIAYGKKTSHALKEFIETEASLTEKELDERRSRIRHTKQKSQKPRKNSDAELTRHVVESWTKVDRAHWKNDKTRKHNPKHEK